MEKSLFMQELAEDIRVSLLAGQAFHDKVATYPFFKRVKFDDYLWRD